MPLAGVTLIAVQLWWKAVLLGRSYFRQDDFPLLDHALARGFGWHALMQSGGGRLMPLGQAVAWAVARAGLYDWALACTVTLVLLAAASLALLRVLVTLFGARPAILIPLAVFCFSPLSLAATAWWSLSLQVLPLEAALFLAVHAHVRYLRHGRLLQAVAAAAWLAVGMAASSAGAVVPLLLLALTLAFCTGPADVRWRTAARQVLARSWLGWVLYGAVLAGYIAVFAASLPVSGIRLRGPGPVAHVFAVTADLIGTALLPGALGGPWRWSAAGFAQASPPAAAQQLAWAAVAAIIAVTCASRVRAWRAWAILLGWVLLADVAPLLTGPAGGEPGTLLATQTQYLTDTVGILALCLGLAVLPLAGEPGGYRPWLPATWNTPVRPAAPDADPGAAPYPDPEPGTGPGAGPKPGADRAPGAVPGAGLTPGAAPDAVRESGAMPGAGWESVPEPARQAGVALLAGAALLVVIFVAGSFWSLLALESATRTGAARAYIDNARTAMARVRPGTVIVDGPVPARLMDPGLFSRQGYASRVIGPLARARTRLTWIRSPRGALPHLMIVNGQGQLRPAVVRGPTALPAPEPSHGPGHGRGHGRGSCQMVTFAGTSARLAGSLYRWPWTVRLTYRGPAADLQVSFGGTSTVVPVPAGQHLVYVPVLGQGQQAYLSLAQHGPPACVTDLTVGSLHPARAGPRRAGN